MRLQFIGSGDAFGSGGRLNTCFHVTGQRVNFLIDCGTSSLIGLKRQDTQLNDIQAILVTHFHVDHFGGIPFFILNAQFFSKRNQPLTIAGPPGLVQWYERVMEISFPGSSKTKPKFALSFLELKPKEQADVAGVKVRPFQALHGDSGGPFFSYRLEVENRTLTYSGDTEWTNELFEAAFKSDLFIAEAYFFEKKIKFHLDLATLTEQVPLIQSKRLILTHMSDDMLGHIGNLAFETAYDGKIVEF
jgi:ribonuclease BN (tRNA processing enzyme)